jgi:hypothetical protein
MTAYAIYNTIAPLQTFLYFKQCRFLRTDVMMREIEEQLFDAEEDVRLGKHSEFDQLAQEPANLQLRLDVDLVLLPNMPPAIKDSSNQIK